MFTFHGARLANMDAAVGESVTGDRKHISGQHTQIISHQRLCK